MPNWVTNKVMARGHVIRSMLDASGRIDFEIVAPFIGPHGRDWDGIHMDAEEAAEIICGIPIDDHPLIGSLQSENRRRFDIRNLSDESFEQFIGMVRNWRACSYLHKMDFNRKVWGTKWNACQSRVDVDAGVCVCHFDTAWECPVGVLIKVSERFPKEAIYVAYADEDIGSNCGTFTLENGEITERDIAPRWDTLNEADKEKWSNFARHLTGRQLDESEQ